MIEILYDNYFPILLTVNYIKARTVVKTERYLKTTYIDDYGNTQYSENVYYTIIEDGKETNIIQQF